MVFVAVRFACNSCCWNFGVLDDHKYTMTTSSNPHHTIPHYTTPHHTTLHHTTPHHTQQSTPHHTTPHHTQQSTALHTQQSTPHHATPYYTTPHPPNYTNIPEQQQQQKQLQKQQQQEHDTCDGLVNNQASVATSCNVGYLGHIYLTHQLLLNPDQVGLAALVRWGHHYFCGVTKDYYYYYYCCCFLLLIKL